MVRHLGRALLPALDAPGDPEPFFFDHIACALCSHVAATYGRSRRRPEIQGTSLSPSQQRTAKELMVEDLSAELNLGAVAGACGMSVGRFSRAFRQSTGAPPFRWLRAFRIERAKELVFASTLPLAEIAYACGFSDQAHFTRVFSATVGMSPGAWRRARRN